LNIEGCGRNKPELNIVDIPELFVEGLNKSLVTLVDNVSQILIGYLPNTTLLSERNFSVRAVEIQESGKMLINYGGTAMLL
jgi:hypothetical protein